MKTVNKLNDDWVGTNCPDVNELVKFAANPDHKHPLTEHIKTCEACKTIFEGAMQFAEIHRGLPAGDVEKTFDEVGKDIMAGFYASEVRDSISEMSVELDLPGIIEESLRDEVYEEEEPAYLNMGRVVLNWSVIGEKVTESATKIIDFVKSSNTLKVLVTVVSLLFLSSSVAAKNVMKTSLATTTLCMFCFLSTTLNFMSNPGAAIAELLNHSPIQNDSKYYTASVAYLPDKASLEVESDDFETSDRQNQRKRIRFKVEKLDMKSTINTAQKSPSEIVIQRLPLDVDLEDDEMSSKAYYLSQRAKSYFQAIKVSREYPAYGRTSMITITRKEEERQLLARAVDDLQSSKLTSDGMALRVHDIIQLLQNFDEIYQTSSAREKAYELNNSMSSYSVVKYDDLLISKYKGADWNIDLWFGKSGESDGGQPDFPSFDHLIRVDVDLNEDVFRFAANSSLMESNFWNVFSWSFQDISTSQASFSDPLSKFISKSFRQSFTQVNSLFAKGDAHGNVRSIINYTEYLRGTSSTTDRWLAQDVPGSESLAFYPYMSYSFQEPPGANSMEYLLSNIEVPVSEISIDTKQHDP